MNVVEWMLSNECCWMNVVEWKSDSFLIKTMTLHSKGVIICQINDWLLNDQLLNDYEMGLLRKLLKRNHCWLLIDQ